LPIPIPCSTTESGLFFSEESLLGFSGEGESATSCCEAGVCHSFLVPKALPIICLPLSTIRLIVEFGDSFSYFLSFESGGG